ncbi:uncharacterized protein E5676_scaffold284G00460 [Cucumis melo var. makuwa]|uniref:Uncharacterized protein n=1 Tax=Cucumis melo var. makuwa TaxID=1194695 RepID=A0A5D3DBN7_CUCMM|nr:uncharacterized protein E6C27_scaffold43053G00400 [Cucumis melo var. makuwa]TYK20908.1 uncharacterized protein E5676_scaffold284G00460 [Cucumis melo var. makuwa]
MVKGYPHHGIPECVLMEQFCFELSEDTQQSVDAWHDDGFGLRQERSGTEERNRDRIGDGVERNTMVALLDQVAEMNKLLQSMVLSQVNAARSSVQAVQQVAELDEQRGEASTQAKSSNPLSPPPFSDRLKKKGDDQQFYKFLDILKQFYINIPFVDVLEKMPSHVKFLKDILMKKRRMNDCETVALT